MSNSAHLDPARLDSAHPSPPHPRSPHPHPSPPAPPPTPPPTHSGFADPAAITLDPAHPPNPVHLLETLRVLAEEPADPAALPFLAAALDAGLTGPAALPLAVCWKRILSFCHAQYDRALLSASRFPDEPGPDARERRIDRLGAALHLGRGALLAQIGRAVELATRLPKVRDALAAGDISPAQAAAVADHTRPVADPVAVHAIDRYLAYYAPGQVRANTVKMARRQVDRRDPVGAARRRAEVRERRRSRSAACAGHVREACGAAVARGRGGAGGSRRAGCQMC